MARICGPALRLGYVALSCSKDTRTCAAAMVHAAIEDVRLVKVSSKGIYPPTLISTNSA